MWQQNNTMDQTDETINTPEINKRTVEVKYGITLHTKQTIKVNEVTLLHLYASVAVNHVLPQEATHKILLMYLSLAHPDPFRELRARQVSASSISSDKILTFIDNFIKKKIPSQHQNVTYVPCRFFVTVKIRIGFIIIFF